MCHHAWLIFVLLLETGFHHVGQAGLKLTSGDPPDLASHSAGITDASHHAQPFFNSDVFLLSRGKSSFCISNTSPLPVMYCAKNFPQSVVYLFILFRVHVAGFNLRKSNTTFVFYDYAFGVVS